MKKIIIVALFLILAIQLIGSTLRESPVFDEIAFAPAGYEFLVHHDFRAEPFSPPLTREIIALPMLFDKNVMNDKVFFAPRMMVVLFTLLLGVVIYKFSKKLYGENAGLFALFLFTFEPEILARGHYAMTDLIAAFFFTLSLFLFLIFKKKFTTKKLILFAIVIGLTLSTKFTMLPYLILTLGFFFVLEKGGSLLTKKFWKNNFKKGFLFVTILLISLWSTYFFTFEPPLGYRTDPNRAAVEMAKNNPLIKFTLTQPVPLGSYLSTIKQDLRENYTQDFIKESVFWGQYSRFGFYGFLLIPVFLIKTPIPLMLFFVLAILLTLIGFRKKWKKEKETLIPLFAIIAIVASVLFTHVLFVLRYILPVYPLMIIFSGRIVNVKYRHGVVWVFIVVLSIWYAWGTLSIFPHYISYFNESIGGSKNAYKYVVEGNLDLGQGLISLADYQREKNITNLQLAYFGTANPQKYGLRYERIKDRSINDTKKIVPLKFSGNTIAISATCWYFCSYYRDSLTKNLKPVDFVGGSILIFRE